MLAERVNRHHAVAEGGGSLAEVSQVYLNLIQPTLWYEVVVPPRLLRLTDFLLVHEGLDVRQRDASVQHPRLAQGLTDGAEALSQVIVHRRDDPVLSLEVRLDIATVIVVDQSQVEGGV